MASVSHTFVGSSNVNIAYYDAKAHQILVDFHSGRRYLYSSVTDTVWRSFVTSKSPGRFVFTTLANFAPREVSPGSAPP
jgi:hypothetical protein